MTISFALYINEKKEEGNHKRVLHTIGFLRTMKSYLELSRATKFYGGLYVLAYFKSGLMFCIHNLWAIGNTDVLHQGSVHKRVPLLRKGEWAAPIAATHYTPAFPLLCRDVKTLKTWLLEKSELPYLEMNKGHPKPEIPFHGGGKKPFAHIYFAVSVLVCRPPLCKELKF